MIIERRWMWPLLAGVALVQSAALFDMVYERHRLLKAGREVTLAVHPVDPRDIFRGDYVTLGYDISVLRKPDAASPPDFSKLVPGADAYVTMSPKPEGEWTETDVGSAYPAHVAAGDIVLKGRVHTVWKSTNPDETVVTIHYGIEQYFVPEGTGKTLQEQVSEHKIEAIVAVGSDGTAALKGLVVDGKRHEDPPLL